MVASAVELTVLMPCLNEVQTLGGCIAQAQAFIRSAGIAAEVLIADNGSTDGSQALAQSLGARVIQVDERGYGAALRAGIRSARGRFVVMGDSDLSYDFRNLQQFLHALREGTDLVVGNRFTGGIRPGAMPWLHRYLGNPVLSFIGRRFFGGPLRDFHCGLRGFNRTSMLRLDLVTPGMEFASEMIIKALQADLRVAEVPTTLVILYPGLALSLVGLGQLLLSHLVAPGSVRWPVGIHTQLFAAAAMVLGWQTVLFAIGAVLSRHAAGLDTPHPRERWAVAVGRSPWLALLGGACATAGVSLCASLTWQWGSSGFGALDPEVAMRQIIPGVALALVGMQSVLASIFFAALRSAFESSRTRRNQPLDGSGG